MLTFKKLFFMFLLLPGVFLVTQSCKGKKVNKDELVLYVGGGCPYCSYVTDFIRKHNLTIPTKDVWKDSSAKKELLAMTGKGQVPCLKLNKKGDYMHESRDIVTRLKAVFNLS